MEPIEIKNGNSVARISNGLCYLTINDISIITPTLEERLKVNGADVTNFRSIGNFPDRAIFAKSHDNLIIGKSYWLQPNGLDIITTLRNVGKEIANLDVELVIPLKYAPGFDSKIIAENYFTIKIDDLKEPYNLENIPKITYEKENKIKIYLDSSMRFWTINPEPFYVAAKAKCEIRSGTTKSYTTTIEAKKF